MHTYPLQKSCMAPVALSSAGPSSLKQIFQVRLRGGPGVGIQAQPHPPKLPLVPQEDKDLVPEFVHSGGAELPGSAWAPGHADHNYQSYILRG